MPKIRAPAVFLISAASAAAIASVIVYPLAASSWTAFTSQRFEKEDFISAADSEQNMIVKTFLLNELAEPPLCSPSGVCPKEPIYFDRLSAVLRSSEDPAPWAKYELRSMDRAGALINRADTSLPLPLQALLDQLTQTQTENSDPMLPNVTYVSDPNCLPQLGNYESRGRCTDLYSPRLVRISRAAVQESQGIAAAFVSTTYCGGGSWQRIKQFKRQGTGWQIVEDRQNGP